MHRLLLGAILWFYAGWYAGAMAAHALHAPSGFGLLGGVVLAGVVLARLVPLWRRGAPGHHRSPQHEVTSPRAM